MNAPKVTGTRGENPKFSDRKNLREAVERGINVI